MEAANYEREFLFRDRHDAGRRLATQLLGYQGIPGLIVLALPRGGVPVGYEVAKALHAPLDVFIVRKLGVPWQEELAMGAVASNGTVVFNDELVRGVPPRIVQKVLEKEREEIALREELYRRFRAPLDLKGRFVILVDDGLATGASMRVAVTALRESFPALITVAIPVAPKEACAVLEDVADKVICDVNPWEFRGVSWWYEDFTQTSDEEVLALLAEIEYAAPPGGPISDMDGG